MSQNRDQYLVNLHGATHEVFGGDPDEIVLRVRRIGEGARTLRDFAVDLRSEADRYGRLHRGGWRLVAPFDAGEGRCRKTAEPGQEPGVPTLAPVSAPPESLAAVVEGAVDLPEAAARLRVAADAYERVDAEGRRLARPVAEGRVSLA
ncbi:MAG TPA: hypothetical protein VM324_04800 [Egibacteraceae bacterium]|nr:hypothetical protein [Egibacteraceae bacterium]